ncbi:MAG: hypothetical protein KKG09_01085 [Verrucomicrobia bacterium]|nr:hypothetical protein [Verrucomicrobiota bacterium]MBU4246803.1 hypothetical protein [Verrucomicrobiota bacterium]MBU4290563.1 hypothetical protein [Verrucomicrobiota bacterium]MBU4496587.1 hypothetical protein [Verrucomicrobiota bacterium]MCG2681221.1 hypothetical protein [Kiritimatiellia bacterium]
MRKTWLLSCGIVIVLAGGGFPWPGASAPLIVSPVEVEFRQLERDIPSLYLINGLFLSADQSKSLAALQGEGKQVTDKIRLDLNQFLLNHEQELNQWLEETLQAGAVAGKGRGGASKDWAQRQKVRKEWMDLLNAKGSDLDDLAGKTLAVLTPAQADIVSRFVPCFIPPRDFRSPERVGQADGDTSVGETILSRLREVPREKQDQGLERALDILVPCVMKNQHAALTTEEIKKLRANLSRDLDKMIRKIQVMNDADFQLEKSKLVQEILCLEEKQAPESDSREVLNKVKRYLLNPGIQDILIRRSGAAPASDSVPIITQELQDAALRERGKPFRAVGLANELGLTPTQAGQLLPIIRAVVERRQRIDEQARQIMQEALPAYQALVKELADQQPASRTETTASRYHQKVKELFEDDYMKELLVAEGQVDLLLATDQIALLSGQKKNGKSKAAGSKKPNDKITKEIRRRATAVFDAMDKASDADWLKIKSDTCRRFIESCVRNSLIDRQDVDVAAQSVRAEQVLDKAHKMVQTDYLRAREDLIVEICPRRNQPRPAVYGWKKSHGDPLESLNPTTYLLFSPAMETVLERAASRKPGMLR